MPLRDQRPRVASVPRSREFVRILNLPRRVWEDEASDYAGPLTEFLRTPRGEMTLLDWQAMALAYAFELGGLFCQAPVGSGKTIVSLVLPVLLEALRPVLLVPASTRDKTLETDIPFYRQHFRMHPRLQILSYEEVSTGRGYRELMRIKPDLLVCDEMQAVSRTGAARTRRFRRFFKDFPGTRFFGMSGTVTKRELRDYRHLLQLALGPEGTPLPPYPEIKLWSAVLDEKPRMLVRPGALEELCEEGESVRSGYRRRLGQTPGVMLVTSSSCDADLRIESRSLRVPKKVEDAIAKLQNTWCTPGGEECSEAIELYRHMRELSCGFYYRWVWPVVDGKEKVNREWVEARANWHRFVRETIRNSRRLDSPMDVANALIAGEIVDDGEYDAWCAVRDEYEPRTRAVWLDRFLVDDVVEQAEREPSLVWVEHKTFGAELAARGVPYAEGGVTEKEILSHAGGSLALSVHAHRLGKNIQPWSRNVVPCPSTSGNVWEQMLGRTHRQGQTADVVSCLVYQHTEAMTDALASAIRAARYVQETTGSEQKLLLADYQEG